MSNAIDSLVHIRDCFEDLDKYVEVDDNLSEKAKKELKKDIVMMKKRTTMLKSKLNVKYSRSKK